MTSPGPSPELAHKIDTLEQLATEKLQQPDGTQLIVSYQFDLSDHYSVQVKSELRSGQCMLYEIDGQDSRLDTALFIGRRDPKADNPRQWGGLAFSALYDHPPQDELGGVQYDAPHLLQRDVYPLTHNQGELFIATLALSRYIDSLNGDAFKYAKRPVLSKPIEECDDDDLEEYSAWQQAHGYELAAAAGRHTSIGAFLVAANTLLAEGTILRQTKRGQLGGHGSVYVEDNSVSGLPEHVDFRLADRPRLQAAIIADDVEYEYVRTHTGVSEVRFHSSDYVERYKGLKSFEWIDIEEGDGVDDDEEPAEYERAFSYDQTELDAIEAEERAMGLYVPTAEPIDLIISRLHSLPSA